MPPADEPCLQRACPACGSTILDPTWRMSSQPPVDEAPFSDLRDSWRGFFKDRKLFFTYRRCADCAQVYAPRYFTPAQLGELYRQMDDNTGGQPEALMAQTQRGYLDLLRAEGELPPGGFLELGPDVGLFTREALALADFSPCWMIEPNLTVHPALEQILRRRDHALLTATADIARVPDNSLALVVAIHVLDHLLEPQPLLDLLHRKLRPGGALLAVTHHQGSLLARLFGRRWPAYCLQHPQLYAPATLRACLARAGFAPVRVRSTVNYFPVTYLLQHLLFAAGLGRVRLPTWSDWNVGLKLGNIAAIARKPSLSAGG